MRRVLLPLCLLLAAAFVLPAPAEDEKKKEKEEGFVPLYNGRNLKGWVKVNNAPGTFKAKGEEIITTGVPTGYMRTDKMYENFIAEFEWKHLPPKPGAVGNSGFFVWADALPAVGSPFTRGIEVQVLVNLEYRDKKSGKVTATSHGDLFSIWGATCVPDRPHPLGWARCLPSENRAKGAGEWNHYRVEAKDGVIKLAVNGKVVSGVSKCKPRKGYLGLEAEGSECRFRNLKIKELPSTNPKSDEICQAGQGFRTLFTGLDLAGWKVADDQKKHWKANPGPNVLRYDGKGDKGEIQTEKEYGDFELIFDGKFPATAKKPMVQFRPEQSSQIILRPAVGDQHGKWHRYTITFKGNKLTVKVTDNSSHSLKRYKIPFDKPTAKGAIMLLPDGAAEFCNLFIRELK
jgi:hypothetical protein